MAQVNSVKILKLITGEELIGTVLSMNDKKIVVSKPAVIVYSKSPQGDQISIGFGKFMPLVDLDEVPVNTATVMVVANPDKNITQEYLRIAPNIVSTASISAQPAMASIQHPTTAPVGPTVGPTLIKG